MRWIEKRKGAFGNFERGLLVLGKWLKKQVHFGGKYCCLGAPLGVPRVPDGRCMSPCHSSGGLREEKVHLAIFRKYYWFLPSWKAAKENRLVSGVNVVVWGL